ncbi:tetratricopeptide repeat protein [Sedimentisphaera salicampi]|uniref:Tetratricopeptide repeat-like domain-containing protein n=1 Tax=Sedimentisphaera salicampi TaxID=1941349 RepID=A0A1W6LPM0_9BACT|nr:hypothetical protein [Sedimentisphaera salicampi]ARN57729.1 hypothetical protein STSP1_02151 [Sedimentisphaera salicampi]OXU14287.1 hypothetical protein SMSP1_02054 [Sedimentisphaera salicampi]
MDSEERHELKRNDFEEFIKNAPGFIKKYIREIISICLIVAAGIMWLAKEEPVRPEVKQQAAVNDIFQEVNTKLGEIRQGEAEPAAIDPLIEKALSKADNLTSPVQRGFAYVKAADAMRASIWKQDAQESEIKEALQMYQKAEETASEDPLVDGMAKFGTALCRIDLEQFDQASNILGKLVTSEKYSNTALPELAEKRLKFISDLKTDFNFAENNSAQQENETAQKEQNQQNEQSS